MDWVFVMWITVNSGSLTTQRMSEAQCRAAITEFDRAADPIMAYCYGPRGQVVRTEDIIDRMRRLKGRPPLAVPPPEAPKAKAATQL